MKQKLHPSTLCVQAGYEPANGEPRQMPIIQSTTFKYTTSDEMGRLFDLEEAGYFYTRLQNPTNDRVAARLAALEGGVAGMLTSSGQAANFFACFNICEAGSHMISTAASSPYACACCTSADECRSGCIPTTKPLRSAMTSWARRSSGMSCAPARTPA